MTGSVVGASVEAKNRLSVNINHTNVNTLIKNVTAFEGSPHDHSSDQVVKKFLKALQDHNFSTAKKLAASLDGKTREALGLADKITTVDKATSDKTAQAGAGLGDNKNANAMNSKTGGASGVKGPYLKDVFPSKSDLGASSNVGSGAGFKRSMGFAPNSSGFNPVMPSSASSGFGSSSGFTGSYSGSGDGFYPTPGGLPSDVTPFKGFSSDETDRGGRWLDFANSVAGVYKYAWGGGSITGPTLGIRDGGVADSYGDYNTVGFDCSGLALYGMYSVEGVTIPRTSEAQYGFGAPVSKVFPGCLGFCEFGSNGPGHVVIAIDDGVILQAKCSGTMVSIDNVDFSAYTWRSYVDQEIT